LPALLFDIIAHAAWADIWQPGFIATFSLGSIVIFAAAVAIRVGRGAHLADAAIDGLNAGYANTGFIGFPLALVTLGSQAMASVTIATILTVCIVFAVAIVLIEVGLRTEKNRGGVFVKVARTLVRNPLIVSPAAGAMLAVSGLTIPAPAETFLKLLGGAASPCALVALGLFLAAPSNSTLTHYKSSALLVGLKLIAQPVLTFWLASSVFHLSPLLTHSATLLAALPTGTGPFMLAEFYNREAVVTSKTILISTALSVLTVSGYLALVT
jgi:predicted permease